MNKKATCLVIVALYLIASYFCEKQTDTFSLSAISSNRLFEPTWQTRPLSPDETNERDHALSQKYRYFGKGGQCYAFFSEDGNYVIKFLKQKAYEVPFWHHLIPIPYLFNHYKEKKRLRRLDKIQRDFFSYKVAFENLQEITGVLYVHLNPTQDLKKGCTLVDLLNIEHQIDLNQFDFILQKRSSMIYPTLALLIKEKNSRGAQSIIDQIIGLIVYRCQKGYEDWDPDIRTNCGLLNDRVIKIDVGRFIENLQMKDKTMCSLELSRIMTPLNDWLKIEDPELAAYCDEAVKRALSML
jgi:hypothetical protein